MSTNRLFERLSNPNTIVFIRQLVIGLLVIGFFSMILVGIWYGTRIEALTLTAVKISGGETVNHDRVREVVERELDGVYLGMVPRRFAWLYPEQSILEAVKKIDRVRTVSLQRVGGRELNLWFDEYIPKALWCTAVDSTDCLFLDASGYAFATAPVLTGGGLLRFVEIGKDPGLHESVASTALIESAVLTVSLLEEMNWLVSHVEVGREGDVYMKLIGGGELKVDLTKQPSATIENLRVILESDEFKHLLPGNFQYIDLRFGDKIYVSEKPPDVETEVASSTEAEVGIEIESNLQTESSEQ